MKIVKATEAGRHAARVVRDSGTNTDLVEQRKAVDAFISQNKETYDAASLVMIPGGIKSGKLHSLKPTDGTGDFTFSRNSVKWVRGKDGYYREAPVNVPALEWSPTAQKFGVLSEPQATNLCMQSWNFSNVVWIKGGASIDNNSGTGYDCPFLNQSEINLKRGFKLIESSAAGTHYLQNFVTGITSGSQVTINIFAKYDGSRARILISDENIGAASQGLFNLQTGTVVSGGATSKSITHIVDGWYLCSVTYTTSVTGVSVRFYLHNGSSVSYAGDGVSGLLISQASVVQAAAGSSPIFTDGATVTRLADSATVTIPAGVNKITTTVNNVDVVDNSPTPGATYSVPTGLISKILME